MTTAQVSPMMQQAPRRAPPVALAIGLLGVAVTAPLALRGAWSQHSFVAFGALLLATSLVVCGACLVGHRSSAVSGWWTLVVGVLWVLNNAGVDQSGPWPFVNWCVSALVWVPVAMIISCYPRAVPWSREHRWWLVVAATYLGPGCAALTTIGRPEWSGFAPGSWWPTLVASRSLFQAASAAAGLLYVMLAFWFVRIIRRRLTLLSSIDRAVLRPALWGTGAAALLASVASLVQNLVLTSEAWAYSVCVQGLGLMALPVVVALSAHRGTTTRERVADLVLQLGRAPSHESVRDLLRRSLDDETLDVVYQAGDRGTFVDHRGVPVPAPSTDRLVVPVRGSHGGLTAVVSADPRLRQHEALVDTTVLAASFVLANVRLQAELRARVVDVEAARALVVDTQRTERERVADDLHDGLQQALLGLAARARAVQAITDDATLDEAAREVADHALEVLERVRLVARGLSSPLLRSEGLDVALEEVTDHLGIAVDLEVLADPVSERVKDVAYMWVSEALASVRDAGASQAWVALHRDGDFLHVDIRDDRGRDACGKPWTEAVLRTLERRAAMADGTVRTVGVREGMGATGLSLVLHDPQPAGT